jgi:hypothetical protein
LPEWSPGGIARTGFIPAGRPRPRAIALISLFPKQEDFFALFRRQAALARKGADLLHEMLERFDRLEERAQELKAVEHEADGVTHDIFAKLNRTFVTPLEREDIHDLASGLDDVLDAVEAIGTRLVLFKIPRSTPAAVQLAMIIARASAQIEEAVGHLRDSGGLLSHTVEINRLENEADSISRLAVADLFSGTHDLLDVMRWREIYGRLEGAADKCEDVANTIESIVLKNQ